MLLSSLSYSNGARGVNAGGEAVVLVENTIHGNTGDGIGGFSYGSIFQGICAGNILTNNGGYGLNENLLPTTISKNINYNAFRSNTSGARNAVAAGPNDVTLSADPYTNAGAGYFSLNATAGGGAACKGVGYPGVFPAGLSTGYHDLGAVQTQNSGGGGGSVAIPISGRMCA